MYATHVRYALSDAEARHHRRGRVEWWETNEREKRLVWRGGKVAREEPGRLVSSQPALTGISISTCRRRRLAIFYRLSMFIKERKARFVDGLLFLNTKGKASALVEPR